MPTPLDPKLYQKAKAEADKTYSKPSAYKSGYIVKLYKQMGGQYKDDDHEKKLKRWFSEKWIDINDGKGYPVFRPTLRINEDTPKTVSELNPKYIMKQIKLKQKIKGPMNLPKFK